MPQDDSIDDFVSHSLDYDLPNEPISKYIGPRDITNEVAITKRQPTFIGNYSCVYLGKYRDEMVAIKVLKVVPGSNTHAMRRKMDREREVWAALDHVNIVPFYGYAEDDQLYGSFGALVSPWYSLGDAGHYLLVAGHIMDLTSRSTLWRGVIEGVSYLHNHDPVIIHGDLKPSNILVDDQGVPKICDFGLARIFSEEMRSGLTTTSEHTGTERYLAYELVVSDGPCLPTKSSDIYALGCIGLEFIFLQVPYAWRNNNRAGHITLDIRNKVPPASRSLAVDSHSKDLWDLLDMCWRLDPASRPSTLYLTTFSLIWHTGIDNGAMRQDETEDRTINKVRLRHSAESGGHTLLHSLSSSGMNAWSSLRSRLGLSAGV